MNFLRKRFIFSLKYLTSPFEYRIFTLIIKKSDKLLWKQKMAFVSRLRKIWHASIAPMLLHVAPSAP